MRRLLLLLEQVVLVAYQVQTELLDLLDLPELLLLLDNSLVPEQAAAVLAVRLPQQYLQAAVAAGGPATESLDQQQQLSEVLRFIMQQLPPTVE